MELGSIEEAGVKYSVIYYFESSDVQGKYFDEGGNLTEGGTAAIEKLGPTSEKMDELGTNNAPTLGWMILQGTLEGFQTPGSRWGFEYFVLFLNMQENHYI